LIADEGVCGRLPPASYLEDLLEEIIGEFDDETDPIIGAARRAGLSQSAAHPGGNYRRQRRARQ
jgi:Mg2+/Co2+ transporter CorB